MKQSREKVRKSSFTSGLWLRKHPRGVASSRLKKKKSRCSQTPMNFATTTPALSRCTKQRRLVVMQSSDRSGTGQDPHPQMALSYLCKVATGGAVKQVNPPSIKPYHDRVPLTSQQGQASITRHSPTINEALISALATSPHLLTCPALTYAPWTLQPSLRQSEPFRTNQNRSLGKHLE